MFSCDKCGLCCRNIDKIPELKAFHNGDGICKFLINNKCSIYSLRPKICRDYGVKYYIQCPYNGMKTIPDSQEERSRLTTIVQDVFFNKVRELGGKFNLVPHTAKNVIK